MGLIDAFNRWRLARKGMSSGRKRRTSRDDTLAHSLSRSVWVRVALYVLFIGTCGVLTIGTVNLEEFQNGEQRRLLLITLIVALTGCVLFQVQHREIARQNGRVILVFGGLAMHLLLLRGVGWIVEANQLPDDYRFLLIPFALVPMTHAVLLGRGLGTFSAIYVSLLGCLIVGRDAVMSYLVVSLVAGLTAVQVVHDARHRGRLLRGGFYVGGVVLLLSWILGQIEIESMADAPVLVDIQRFGLASLAAFVTGVITAMVVSGVLPVLEALFRLTTEISWLELSDLNNRLLRRMQLEAPGTFHHSLVVAGLAEAAAESIGASAATARVCSYFHDIGKLVKPLYFIENQADLEENPHDTLTPTMSALIIIAHVKDGVDLALKHKLNPRIIDVIREHHGDSLVYYFYHKAREQRKADLEKVSKGIEDPDDLPKIDEKSFRYPGPRPRTRESGIISLADAIESASRSLQKPTPSKIRAMIDEIVQTRVKEGQLDDCELTLRELALVKETFAKTLRSMIHTRVDYPKDEDKGSSGGGRKSDIDRERRTTGGRRSKEGGQGAGQPKNPTQRPDAGRNTATTKPKQ